MSAILYLVIGILLVGALLSYVLARYKLGYSAEIGVVVFSLALIIWLLAGQNLPLQTTLSNWPDLEGLGSWQLTADSSNWQLAFGYLLLGLAGQLMSVSKDRGDNHPSRRRPLGAGLTVLLSALVLLHLWSSTFAGLLIAQVAMIIVWTALFTRGFTLVEIRRNLSWGWATLVLSALFLWLAGIFAGEVPSTVAGEQSLPSTARALGMVAGIALLGAFPLHWWRPLDKDEIDQPKKSLLYNASVYIAPAATGGSLLVRFADGAPLRASVIVLLTTVGFAGVLFGAYKAWQDLERPARIVGGVACAQASIVVLSSVWAERPAVIAEVTIQILALGGIFIGLERVGPRPRWYWLIPLAALAGLPITVGFIGRAALFGTWIDAGQTMGSAVLSLLFSSVIAAAILATFGTGPSTWFRIPRGASELLADVAMLLIFLGLLALPRSSVDALPSISWLLIIAPAVFGSGLAARVSKIAGLGLNLKGILDWQPGRVRLLRIVEELTSTIGRSVRFSAKLFEGEGGVLWLLVLLIVLYLVGST